MHSYPQAMGSHRRDEERAHLVADPRNRAIVAIVSDADRPLGVRALAELLVRRDATVIDRAEYEERVEDVQLALHHNHLPKLSDAGLVEYDREANVVSHRTSAAQPVDWRAFPTAAELVADLRSDSVTEDEIGILEGRDAVIEYGRELADAAEEELFCMYVSTDLLEEECVRRAAGAIDRGVRLCMGSESAAVRDLTRNRLPEATIWEPQLDWSNGPRYPRVGRLVLADRRKVMLAVLEAPTAEGASPGETAVVGEGEDNPLVVLVRELLGSRLDHLDYQSTDFRSELPS